MTLSYDIVVQPHLAMTYLEGCTSTLNAGGAQAARGSHAWLNGERQTVNQSKAEDQMIKRLVEQMLSSGNVNGCSLVALPKQEKECKENTVAECLVTIAGIVVRE